MKSTFIVLSAVLLLATLSDSTPVHVEVYYESYCPDSKNFIVNQLKPTWDTLSGTNVMTARLVPYGKATTSTDTNGDYTFSCQHGEKECLGNRIQNCEIYYSNNVTADHIDPIACMMGYSHTNGAGETCLQQTDSDLVWSEIEECANGVEGRELLNAAGLLQEDQASELNWVPWIMIDGVHTQYIQTTGSTNLLKLVCDTYESNNDVRPSECPEE